MSAILVLWSGYLLNAQVIKEIKIGNSVWMAENLKLNIKGSIPYNENNNNVNKYGRLYTWEAAKNACPVGWHLPSSKEWENLIDYFGGADKAGKFLKTGGPSGFNAPLSGIANLSNYVLMGLYGAYWTSSSYSDTHAWYIFMTNRDNLVTSSYYNKNYGLSVRCIKN